MKKYKNQNAITLVALVVTIIILLILAGISISTLTNTGIFQKTQDAKSSSENAEKEQSQILDEFERELNKYTSAELTSANVNVVLSTTENVELHDKNGNKIVVPAGFKVVVNDDTNNVMTIEKGIVVEDGRGNQYVWIPCTTEDSKTQLQYKRTEWYVEDDTYNNIRSSKDELTLTCSRDYNNNGLTYEIVNEIVTQVKSEKESISKYGGYYIGRYEVGDEDGTAVIKYDKMPKTDVKWIEAYDLAKNIGSDKCATTYLCSSYAWDTAINFIQNNGFPNYAKAREDDYNENWYDKMVIWNGGSKPSGTSQKLETGKTTAKCNIFDMGGNVVEYTTEVIPNLNKSIVQRGGGYHYSIPAGNRIGGDTAHSSMYDGFRATLFLK